MPHPPERECLLLVQKVVVCPLKTQFINRCFNSFECDIKRGYKKR